LLGTKASGKKHVVKKAAISRLAMRRTIVTINISASLDHRPIHFVFRAHANRFSPVFCGQIGAKPFSACSSLTLSAFSRRLMAETLDPDDFG
jgi:hypothetical protein